MIQQNTTQKQTRGSARMSPETIARGIQLHEERGYSVGRLVATLGHTPGAWYYRLMQAGFVLAKRHYAQPDNGRHKRFTPEEDARIEEMRLQGKRYSEIGRAVGRQGSSCRMRLLFLAALAETRAEQG